MKKSLFALFAMTFLFAGVAFAQQTPDPATDPAVEEPAMEDPVLTQDPAAEEMTQDPAQQQPSDDATASAEQQEIQFDELPETVKSSFEESDYAMWQVQTVYEMPASEGTDSKMYELTVTDGSTEETVTFNEEGEQQ